MSTIVSTVSSQAGALSKASHVAAQNVLIARTAERYSSSGIWVGVFAITMSFGAFSSALFVREGTADWSHLALPGVLYFNTLVLLVSSFTLENARKALEVRSSANSEATHKASAWVVITLLLGLGLPEDNAHSPNEKYDLDNFENGQRMSALLWQELA